MRIYENGELNEKLYNFKSEAGLEVFYLEKKGFSKQYAIFSTNFGSVDNKFKPIGEDEIITVPDGIAHFLEHKLFEEPKESIFDKFAEYGADVNAYTGFNQTSYLFSSTENFYECLKLLIRFVQNPYLTDENVEKEKGIIEQEIKMSADEPGWKVFFNCLDSMYYNHPVKIDIAGTVQSIKEIDKDILLKSYNTFYHPRNMVIYLVGDLDIKEIMDIVNLHERKDYKELNKIERFFEDEPMNIKDKYIEEEMSISIPRFYLGFKDSNLNLTNRDLVKKEVVTNILLDMLFADSSYFYNYLYNKELIDNNFAAYYSGGSNYGHSLITGAVEDPNKVSEEITRYLKEPMDNNLKEEDFIRIKNDEIGDFIMNFDSLEFIGDSGTEFFFSGINIFEYLEILNEIEFEDIRNRYKEHLEGKESALSIITPTKTKEV